MVFQPPAERSDEVQPDKPQTIDFRSGDVFRGAEDKPQDKPQDKPVEQSLNPFANGKPTLENPFRHLNPSNSQLLLPSLSIDTYRPGQKPSLSLPPFQIVGDKPAPGGKPTAEKPGVDKPSAEKPSAEKPAADKPAADKPAADKPAADKPAADKPAAEKPAAEKPAAEKPAADKPAAEKPAAEKPAAEKPAAEKPAAEKPAAEKPAAEKPAAEKPAADKPAADKPGAKPADDKPFMPPADDFIPPIPPADDFVPPMPPADDRPADKPAPKPQGPEGPILPPAPEPELPPPPPDVDLNPPAPKPDAEVQPAAPKPEAGPELPPAPKPEVQPETQNNIRRYPSGQISDIAYPGGRTRNFERDGSGNVTAITTRDAEGTTTLRNRNGSWFLAVQGMEIPFQGKVQVDQNGDVCIQNASAEGVWRREKPDGTVKTERENADGSRVGLAADNTTPERITRRDGYTVERVNENTIVETRAGQAPITWTRGEGDTWNADSTTEKPRKAFALNANGSISFEDATGIKHTINGNGSEVLEGQGLAKLSIDEAGRIKELETPDGKRVRKYDYFDNSNDIKTLTIVDKSTNPPSTTIYSRDKADSRQWNMTDEQGRRRGTWYGEVQVSQDGVHSVRQTQSWDQYGRPIQSTNQRWTSYHPDGKQTSDTIAADGTRTSYNERNEVVALRTADGLKLDRSGDSIRVFDPRVGETVTWTKGEGDMWRSDSARFTDARKNLAFNDKGEFTFSTEGGDRVLLHRNNTREVTKPDGSKLDFDAAGNILTATRGNLVRTFVRGEDGQIQSVKDKNTTNNQEKTIFDRKPAGEETRTHIHVGENGDFSYQNADGTATIERSNMVTLQLDKDGDTISATGPRSSRQYTYVGEGDNKQLVSVTDTRQTEQGPKTDVWTRQANPDGTLSAEFHSKTPDGKDRKPRLNITPCADGEYEYRYATDKPGDKVHVARLSREGGENGISESVEEAHYELMAQLESHMDQPRRERFERMMKKYEDRMNDQLELLLAAGVDEQAARQDIERSITEAYFHTGRLLTDNAAGAIYDKDTRIKLAENIMYHAADPTTIKQGNTGVCWWQSSWNVGLFQRNVNHAARLIADVALTGEYTSTAGPRNGGARRHVRVPRDYVAIDRRGDRGANWTVDNAHTGSHRSPVAMIIDQVGPPVNGSRGWGRSNGGGHGEARNILYMLTGRDDIRHGNGRLDRHEKLQLLKTGGFTESGGGHMWAYTMHKRGNEWHIVRDDQYEGRDRVVQVVRNLREWLSNDVKEDVRRTWRPFRPNDTNQPIDTQPDEPGRPSQPWRPFRPRRW